MSASEHSQDWLCHFTPPPFFVTVADKGLSSSGDAGKTRRLRRGEALQDRSVRGRRFAELAELCGLVAEDLEAAFEVGLHEFELFCGVAGGVLEGGCGEALVKTTNTLKSFEARADKDLAAIARVAEALDEASLFEAIENAGDGAGGEASVAGEVAGCKGSLRITGH
jgi:hypothetical protein